MISSSAQSDARAHAATEPAAPPLAITRCAAPQCSRRPPCVLPRAHACRLPRCRRVRRRRGAGPGHGPPAAVQAACRSACTAAGSIAFNTSRIENAGSRARTGDIQSIAVAFAEKAPAGVATIVVRYGVAGGVIGKPRRARGRFYAGTCAAAAVRDVVRLWALAGWLYRESVIAPGGAPTTAGVRVVVRSAGCLLSHQNPTAAPPCRCGPDRVRNSAHCHR
ncbi:hypothetical protein FHR53_000869 [Xanthomonas arboricola]